VTAIERLAERLETGWQPKRDEIDPAIKQVELTRWVMLENWREGRFANFLAGFDVSGIIATGPVLVWGKYMEYALTVDGLYWLSDG
jgi:hypothetical protein